VFGQPLAGRIVELASTLDILIKLVHVMVPAFG
jgi:hypothetical protein